MYAYLHTKESDGSCHLTQKVEVKLSELWWQKKNLLFTATGYGNRIPTRYMIKYNGKWRRVYCCIHSNSGTCYIGPFKTMALFRVSEPFEE